MKRKNKFKLVLPESVSIPFDLHFIRTEIKSLKKSSEKFHYMNKYTGDDSILDFYKKNSNIIDPN